MKLRLAALLAVTLLSACRHAGDITAENGGGVYAVRSACPIAGVPAGDRRHHSVQSAEQQGRQRDRRDRGDHRRPRDLPGCRQRCRFDGDLHHRRAETRRRARAPGVVPYFDVALQGGTNVVAKRVGQAVLNFAAGDLHAWARVQATVRVNRGAATLPANVRQILTRPRKAGEAEAAIDPLADPAVRTAVANATFEHLVGFQLTQDQLKYNATR